MSNRPPRQEFASHVRLRVEGKEQAEERFAESLSSGGLFIRHDRPPAVGSVVQIELVLPDGTVLSRITTRVVHSRPADTTGAKTAGMGLLILELDDVAQGMVVRLREHAAQSLREVDENEPRQRMLTLDASERVPFFKVAGPVVGIDLGTINSCIAIVQDGQPSVIPSGKGYETIPSIVFHTKDDKLLVGHEAAERMILNPRQAVYGSKRFLGRPFASREVKSLGHFFNYELTKGDDGRTAAKVNGQILRLEEVAAHVLSTLKDMAEQHLGESVQRAVITIPAYFGEVQRAAVREAGRLAGFYVERVLNEPTAAAVAFNHGREVHRTVLVYDLGGGTFDASILRIDGQSMEVRATDGDPFLGGSDFDDRLTEYVLSTVEHSHGVDLRGDQVAVQRTRFAVELAKRQLSESDTATISLPYLAKTPKGYLDLEMSLERDLFERLTEDLVDRTFVIVEGLLKDAGLSGADLDDVLLVGGQTRSPMVKRMLNERFGRMPSTSVHPDQAVAIGAALVADSFYADRPLDLIEILPASIRLGLPGGDTKLILRRGTSLPTEIEIEVESRIREAGKAEFRVHLYRGEGDRVEDNSFLGGVLIPSSVAVTVSKATAQVRVAVSGDGLLSVVATHPISGREERFEASLVEESF